MTFDFDTLRVISGKAIDDALPLAEGVEVIAAAMREVSAGRTDLPLRWLMPLAGGNGMGLMPGAMQSPAVHGTKLISLYPDNPKKGLPSHLGMMLLFDTKTGVPLAVLDASVLTTRRTAAATVVATRALARPGARIHALLGTGELAEAHVHAFAAAMSFAETRIWGRRREAAEAVVDRLVDLPFGARRKISVAERVQDAVSGADVVTTVTAAKDPILFGRDLEPGQHVNLVGASMADAREIDDEGVRRGRVYTDLKASAEQQAGELIGAIAAGAVRADHLIGEIGSVLSGDLPGRAGETEITIYKSHGIAAQDLAYSKAVLERLP
jgi:ornithine cyclodeaminase